MPVHASHAVICPQTSLVTASQRYETFHLTSCFLCLYFYRLRFLPRQDVVQPSGGCTLHSGCTRVEIAVCMWKLGPCISRAGGNEANASATRPLLETMMCGYFGAHTCGLVSQARLPGGSPAYCLSRFGLAARRNLCGSGVNLKFARCCCSSGDQQGCALAACLSHAVWRHEWKRSNPQPGQCSVGSNNQGHR